MILTRVCATVAASALLLTTISAAGVIDAGTASASPTNSPAATRTLTFHDSGKHVTLHKSKQLRLKLDTRSGYYWKITSRPASSKVEIPSHSLHRPNTYYKLKAVGSGTTSIKIVEHHGSKVIHHFNLTIKVPAPKAKPVHHSCTRTSSGSCIQGGEFCPQADYGQAGYDANGNEYICEGDTTHPHWETP